MSYVRSPAIANGYVKTLPSNQSTKRSGLPYIHHSALSLVGLHKNKNTKIKRWTVILSLSCIPFFPNSDCPNNCFNPITR